MRIIPLVIVLGLLGSQAQAGDWPCWRGPSGQGVSAEKDLPLSWDGKTGENIAWKTPLARGDNPYSSPIVVGDKVIITLAMNKTLEHHVLCFNKADGKPLWDTVVPAGKWVLTDVRGGYGAPTPAADGERIYVLFGSAVMAALDFEGKIIWRKDLPRHDFDVAIGCSPFLYKDTILLQADMVKKKSSIMAFDKKSGDLKWEVMRPEMNFAHGTPLLIQFAEKPMLLVAGSDAFQGVDPGNGEIFWSVKAKGDTVSPVYADGVAYIDSGRGGPGFAVAVNGMGKGDASVKWTIKNVPEAFGSPIIVGGNLYRLQGSGILKCYSMADGKEVYTHRLEGAAAAVSPVATADGRIYFASSGKSYVVKAGETFEQLGASSLDDGNYASPAISDGRIYLKGVKFLFCVGTK